MATSTTRHESVSRCSRVIAKVKTAMRISESEPSTMSPCGAGARGVGA
jgi:hypothetical protein